MPSSRYITDIRAAHFLSITLKKLRKLHRLGRGPKFIALSTGAVRYRVEDLDAWVGIGGGTSTVQTDTLANLLTFPGVKINLRRLRLDDPTPKRKPRRRLRQSDSLRRRLDTLADLRFHHRGKSRDT